MLRRDDLMYLPPPRRSRPASHRRVPSREIPPSPAATSSHPLTPAHARLPARRPFLRGQSEPPINQATETGRAAHLPTHPTLSHSPVVCVTAGPSQTRPVNPPARNNGASGQPQQRGRILTLLYPQLVVTDMIGYFKSEDGVSYRPAGGE